MDFNFNWRSPLVTRVAILSATIFALAFAILKPLEFYVIALLVVAVIFQLQQLIQSIEKVDAPTVALLDSIQFDETSLSFSTRSAEPHAQQFIAHINQGLQRVRNARKEKDSEYQFFKNIVQYIGIGILTFQKDGTIQIINSAAKKLLRITRAEHMDDLREVSDSLVEAFLKLKTGGRELVTLKTGEETNQLSVYAIELTLRNEEVKLISMSNIQTELEEKEMEAWQNLVRVLTHEIMNSVTPISSLAGVVEDEIRHHMQHDTPITQDDLPDMHVSLQTISKRSSGLIAFVKEFRSLTHVQKPKIAAVSVQELLNETVLLHKMELASKNIQIEVCVEPTTLTIQADKAMIEQVVINLVKNALQAFDDQSEKRIRLHGHTDEKGNGIITVADNGPGIEPEALEKIFIPFFSTKKTGSGIGLSLSKQIMRMHEGRITVKSEVGQGTEFSLRF
jgi:nitrogen fixation/metabolism regulation signal transduction histidine kinase